MDRFPRSNLEDQNLKFLLPNPKDDPVVADSKSVGRFACESSNIPKGLVLKFTHFVVNSPGDRSVQLLQLPSRGIRPNDLEGHQKPSFAPS